MWKFVTGGKGHPEKRKQTNDEKLAQSKEYEQKQRKRQTQESWIADQPRLRIESVNGEEVMICDWCINAKIFSDKSPFLKGCGNLKVETLKKHEGSNTHLFAKNSPIRG